jgi:hypothetical protein
MERKFNHDLSGSSHFLVKKMVVCGVSVRKKRVVTKIFINWQIERKYNPFR